MDADLQALVDLNAKIRVANKCLDRVFLLNGNVVQSKSSFNHATAILDEVTASSAALPALLTELQELRDEKRGTK